MTTTTSPILPIIPAVKDDELLGSWFSRIAAANQVATWIHLLSQCGYELGVQPSIDAVPPSERYEMLCSALGKSYTSLTIEMTTLPFFLFFESSPSDYLYDGAVKIPARISKGRVVVGSRRIRGNLGRLKYCASCLNEQLADGTGLYWRRSHQLPVSLICSLHPVLLRSACYHCGRVPEMHKQVLLKMPAQQCKCGFDLTALTESCEKFGKKLMSLSQLAAGALNTSAPVWNRLHVLDLARAVIDRNHAGSAIGAFDAMEAYFGFRRHRDHGLSFSSTDSKFGPPSLILEGPPSAWSASTFAAFFVASGMTFTELRKLLDERRIWLGSAKAGSANKSVRVATDSKPKASRFDILKVSRRLRVHAKTASVYPPPGASADPTEHLYKALHRILADQQRPSRVKVRELALIVGVTEQAMRLYIASSPDFQHELGRVNEAYQAERIRWRLRQLAVEQRCIAPTALLLEISLDATRTMIQLVREIANEAPEWAAVLLSNPYDTPHVCEES